MKLLIFAIFTSVLIFMIGCSTQEISSSYKFIEPNASVNNNFGYLKVNTYRYSEKGSYADDPVYKVYKGYSIFTANGEFVKDIEKSYHGPKQIRLEKGDYIVIAELYKNVIQSIPVSIEAGKLFEIDRGMVENPLAKN